MSLRPPVFSFEQGYSSVGNSLLVWGLPLLALVRRTTNWASRAPPGFARHGVSLLLDLVVAQPLRALVRAFVLALCAHIQNCSAPCTGLEEGAVA